jgi:predicted dehydrogenase
MSCGLSPDMRPVIIGYGRAGCDLHHSSLREIADPEADVMVVDPRRPHHPLPGARWMTSLDEAFAFLPDPRLGVFHVTTPAAEHRRTVEALVAADARQIIVEKPLAPTLDEARRIADLATPGVRVLPVSLWLSSAVTRRVEEVIAEGRIGVPVELRMEQSKPRFRRTMHCPGHRTAFEVELPHQVLLALHLGGPVERILLASAWSMELPDGCSLPAMGGACLRLLHTNGMTSTLVTDLTSPVRMRRLQVTGTAGEVIADYPVSTDDDFGQVEVIGESRRSVVPDAPLTQLLHDAYGYFAGRCDAPRGDLALHLDAAELLETAAGLALTATRSEVVPSC